MSYENDELFQLAVKLIRRGRHTGLEIEKELEAQGPTGGDVRIVINKARKYVEETQKAGWECSVAAFKNGESFLTVCKKLEACGWHPYDAQITAARAQAKAEEEQKAEAEQVEAKSE